jgi:hypothetical protein
VHWFFTVLLIAASAGTVAFGAHLLRRLFTTEPPAAADEGLVAAPANITTPVPTAAPLREHSA